MKEKKFQKTKVLGIIALAIFGLGAILAIAGLSNTIGKIDDNVISETPSAVLASAGVTDGKEINLPVAYFDQRADKCVNLYDESKSSALKTRQFEWSSCDYHNKEIEQGLVDYYLSDKYLPVATTEGKLLSNRGINDFSRWFSGVDGKSKSYSGTIKLAYNSSDVSFSYQDDAFYPLDDVTFSQNDSINKDGHNHLFTMYFAVPFTISKAGDETFEISADDDTFVFVGDELAIDLGGIHEKATGKIIVHKDGEVYSAINNEEPAFSGISLGDATDSIIRIFHADRDSEDSSFSIAFSNMNLNVIDSKLAGADEGIQIAYDPSNPSYVAPLGESTTFRPDSTKGYVVMATIFGFVITGLALLIAIFTRHLLRNKE